MRKMKLAMLIVFLCHAFWWYGGFFCSAGPGVFGCGES